MSANSSINLVRGRKPRVLDQFVVWALSIGRAVVILTELIALGAFLYRFGLDRQLVDLHDKIVQEKSIVDLLASNENTYRNLQNRLSLESTIMNNQQQTVKLYNDLLNMVTQDVSLKTLLIDPGSVKMTLDVQSVNSLTSLIDHLKNYPAITNVSIDRIENKTTVGLIGVSITATLKQSETNLLPGGTQSGGDTQQ